MYVPTAKVNEMIEQALHDLNALPPTVDEPECAAYERARGVLIGRMEAFGELRRNYVLKEEIPLTIKDRVLEPEEAMLLSEPLSTEICNKEKSAGGRRE